MEVPKASCLRRMKAILIVAILATLSGYLVSFVFTPRYTSQSEVLVEPQMVPESIVPSLITEEPLMRIAGLEARVLGQHELQRMVERLNLAKHGRKVDDVIEQIQQNVMIEPLSSDIKDAPNAAKESGQTTSAIPGFTLSYTADNPTEAQEICSQLTTMLLTENLNTRVETAKRTTEFLKEQVEEVKHDLQAMDEKLLEHSQSRGSRSPESAGNNKMLARDYDSAQKTYTDLLGKLNQAKVAEEMERQQMSEQMRLVTPASLPENPDFPNRWLFAGVGLGTGLVLGISLALWPATRSSGFPPSLTTASLHPQSEGPQPAPQTSPEKPQEQGG